MPTDDTLLYDVFISYSRKDRVFAARLETALEYYRPPRDLGVPYRHLRVFRDEEDFTGTEYHMAVGQHLRASSTLLVICSPSARQSVYVNDEIRQFVAIHDPQQIVPILISGIPNNEVSTDRSDEMAFPDALCEALALPLPADFRGFDPHRHKFGHRTAKEAWYSVLANICNVSREKLEQREQKRTRTRRMRVAALAAAIATTALYGLYETRELIRQQARGLAEIAGDANNRGLFEQGLRIALLATQAGWAAGDVPEADAELRRAVQASPQMAVFDGSDAIFSPDASMIATTKKETVRLWDVSTGRVIADVPGRKPITFSPDGRLILTRTNDIARLWDVKTGKPIVTLAGQERYVNSANFTASGGLLVTTSADETARIWAVPSGEIVATLTGHSGPVSSATFSRNERLVLTVSRDGTARLWDTTGKQLQMFTDTAPASAIFSPDEKTVLTTSLGNSVAHLWDTATGRELKQFAGADRGGALSGGAFSPEGKFVATASLYDGAVVLWDVTTGQELARIIDKGLVTLLSFSPDGKLLLTASAGGVARLWAVPTGKTVATLRGHSDGIWSASFSPDGKSVLTSANDGTSRLWVTGTGSPLRTISGVETITVDGQLIVVGSDQTASIWDAVNNKAERKLAFHFSSGALTAFSPNGALAATTSPDGTRRVWDSVTAQQLAVIVDHGHQPEESSDVLLTSFSPDNTILVTSWENSTTRLWDAKTGAALKTLPEATVSGTFSPDSRMIVTCSVGPCSGAQLWTVADGQPVVLNPDTHNRQVQFSRDGRYIVTTSDQTVRLWESSSHMFLKALSGQIAWISPDGERVVTVSADGATRIWLTKSGLELARLQGRAVEFAAFSPDDRILATGSSDGAARLWDAATGKELMTLAQESPVSYAAFSADGTRLITKSDNVRIWDIGWLTRPGGSHLVEASCREKLQGMTTVTESDANLFVSLRMRVGIDVCASGSFSSRLFRTIRYLFASAN